MASKSENIRKFRSDVASLKRKGLISGVDARSAVPTPKLKRALTKYHKVLTGEASAVKPSKKGIAEYKALGKPYEIAAPKGLPRRIIVPHEPGERVTVSHGLVRVANPAGVTRTIIPVKYHDLPQYFASLRKQKLKLKEGEYFAFRFYGNRSHKVFRSIDALVGSLEHYESIFDSIEEKDAEQMAELYQNLEIIKVEDKGAWTAPRTNRPRSAWSGASRYQKRKRKLERGPEWKQEQERAANAQRQRDYRKRLKGAAKVEYNKQGKKRAKKSAKKRRKGKRKSKK